MGAVARNDMEKVREYLAAEGSTANHQLPVSRRCGGEGMIESGGDTPLIIAATKGHTAIASLLLEAGADVNLAGAWHKTPMVLALEHGHPETAQLLLDAGADVDLASVDGATALMGASAGGFCAIAKQLLEKGADVNALCSPGTALHDAARNGHLDVVRLLLAHGADEKATPRHTHAYGTDTPVDVVCKGQFPHFCADKSDKAAILKLLGVPDADIEPRIRAEAKVDTNNALGRAAAGGDLKKVRECLENGADVNDERAAPLWSATKPGHLKMVRLLLEKGADPNVAYFGTEGTPLLEASYQGHVEIVKLLLEHGADERISGYTSSDRGPDTPINIARQKHRREVVSLLMRAGAAREEAAARPPPPEAAPPAPAPPAPPGP